MFREISTIIKFRENLRIMSIKCLFLFTFEDTGTVPLSRVGHRARPMHPLDELLQLLLLI